MGNESKGELRHRVVCMLNRQQVDFLDKLGNDALFSTGRKLSHNEILQALVDFAFESDFNGEGIKSANDLKKKLIDSLEQRIAERSIEKRRFPRLSHDLTFDCRVLESGDAQVPGQTQNVSEGGVQLVLPQYFAPQTLLELTIKTKDDSRLLMFGKVAWVKENNGSKGFVTGLELTYVSDKEKFIQEIFNPSGTASDFEPPK